MFTKFGGVLVLSLATLTFSGCQALFGEEEDTSIGALRLAQTPNVASSQRMDEDGFPVLGAFPAAAAPQFTDAQIASNRERYNRIAEQRSGAAPASGYDAKVARAEDLRRRQARAVDAAIAANPPNKGRQIRGNTPEEVLRGIQAEGAKAR